MSVSPDVVRSALEGRFVLEGELGVGGMSVVYLAQDLEESRQVALKVLLPELTASVGGERFLREIEIGKKLSHPHILPIYQSGGAEGLLYYTMPVAVGESLRARLERERQLPVEEALAITREVASALEYAHGQGVVHRDIKPENILLTPGGVVVMDFGIARAVDPEGEERLTKTGLAMGTPAYMSPEQGEEAERVDGRSDQYSLACVLYEMLAGHPPFAGSSAQVVLSRHAKDPVPPLGSARSTVSGPIEMVVHRALSKVPADRFRSAGEFTAALEMAEQGVTPRGTTPIGVQQHVAPGFFAELRRRRVYQVGAGYAVVAWALAQVLEAVAVPLGIPPELHRALIWTGVAGFPVALALAWLYDLTPQGVRRTQAVPLTPVTGTQVPDRARWALTATVLAIGIAGVVVWRVAVAGGEGDAAADSFFDLTSVTARELELNDVAILPFRVSGADSALGEGVPALLDAAWHGAMSERDWTLSTVFELRSRLLGEVDGELSQDQALQIAASLSAGRLIRDGTITRAGDRMTISASVERVPTGTVLYRETVEGPADDMSLLIDRLAALLLDQGWADEVTRRELAAVPPAALQAYLAAVRAHSRLDGSAARSSARRAWELQPDFPAAAFVSLLNGGDPDNRRTPAPVYALRDRLSERKRTWLDVRRGPRWPDRREGWAEQIRVGEAAFERHPEWPELADWIAFALLHWGAYVGREDALQTAANAAWRESVLREGEEDDYLQVWLLNSRRWPPLDSDSLHQLATLALDELARSGSPELPWLRYDVAIFLGDSVAFDSLREAGIHEPELVGPARFRRSAINDGLPGPDALYDFERSIDAWEASRTTQSGRISALALRLDAARVRGKIEEAGRLLDTLSSVAPDLGLAGFVESDPWWYLTVPTAHALVEPGWEELAEWGTREQIDRGEYVGTWYTEGDRICWPGLWSLLSGDLSAAGDASRRLRDRRSRPRVRADGTTFEHAVSAVCLHLIDALVEHQRQPDGPAPALASLDSYMRLGPTGTLTGVANLVVAQFYHERGELEQALEAVRRREYNRNPMNFFPAYLALEGELSLALGDTASAVRAFSHYMRIRPDPDPALRPQMERVRRQLETLVKG